MVNLTIRNIPEEIMKRIKILAARERRSMNSEILIVIEEGLSSRIAAETGSVSFGGTQQMSAMTSLSCAGRERIWTELCGEWNDTRSMNDCIADLSKLRTGRADAGETE